MIYIYGDVYDVHIYGDLMIYIYMETCMIYMDTYNDIKGDIYDKYGDFYDVYGIGMVPDVIFTDLRCPINKKAKYGSRDPRYRPLHA